MKTYTRIYITLASLTPTLALAEPFGGIKTVLRSFGGILETLPPLIFGLALVFFFWGIVQFIRDAGNEKLRADGKQKIVWGVIALFVFVSIYGLIYMLGDLVGIQVPRSTIQNTGGGGIQNI